jgi:hypothetical protein
MSPLWFCAFILIGTRMDYILRDVLSAQLHFFLQPSLHSSTPAYFLLASTAPFFFRLVYLDLYPFIFKMRRFIRVSHFGLTLIFLVTTLAKDVRVDNITWTSPADGDTYSPGDTIIGKWRTSKAVVSPSFRLCPSADQHVSNSSDDSDDGCGSTVWPMVRQSAGSYLISL